MELYKIRNENGMFWRGIIRHQNMPTIYDLFDTEGKLFDNKSMLDYEIELCEDYNRPHRNNLDEFILPLFFKDCKIISFDLIEIDAYEINEK